MKSIVRVKRDLWLVDISWNIRIILDLLDYANLVESDALMVFLDFHKAFDTIEHQFMFRALKIFGFGERFISIIEMFHKGIISSINLYPNTLKDFLFVEECTKVVLYPLFYFL